ncbi:YigZ family protein [Sporolactobacillus sp. THM7-4]|nr:YigZ family protein [Sporolactobacillus sp. THM7-4]
MTLTPYITVMHEAVHEIEIRRSRFIASVFPVSSEEKAAQAIESKRREHWKANHNCFAYIIGENQAVQKASDDGEPSGTAGVPILEVLKKRRLRDVLVVVTRYFGGIKLGAGGLIRAYAHTTSAGLAAAEVVEQVPSDLWRVTVDYPLSGALDNQLRESSYLIKDIHYTDKVQFDVYTRQEESKIFASWITEQTNARAVLEKMAETYLQKKVTEPFNK